MGEKTPDTESSSIERRDVLKGLGFGAVGLAGAGATTSVSAQQNQTPGPGNVTIDYVKVVPEAAEPEVDTGNDTYVDRPWATADLVFGLDFEGENGKNVLDGPIPVGYQFVVVDQQTRQPVTESFEEGRCACFAGNVDVTPGGGTTGRKTFSLSGLGPDQPDQPPNQYIAAMTVTEYRGELDPVLGAYEFAVEDQPPDQNGGEGDQTTTTTQDGGDAGGEGNGGGDDAGGAGEDGGTTTTTTTTTPEGNGGGGNGADGNQTDGNGTDENALI